MSMFGNITIPLSRQQELRNEISSRIAEIEDRPNQSRHIAVASLGEVAFVASELENHSRRLAESQKGISIDYPTTPQASELVGDKPKVKISVVPVSKEKTTFRGAVPAAPTAASIEVIQGVRAPTTDRFDPKDAVHAALMAARDGRLRAGRFSNLPWGKVDTCIRQEGGFVVVTLSRKDSGDESLKDRFCGPVDSSNALTGRVLNQLAGLCKHAIGEAHREARGSDRHSYKVAVQFENFAEERYYTLWDRTFQAVELAVTSGQSAQFEVNAPNERSTIIKFLSYLQKGCGGAFLYEVPLDDPAIRFEEKYPMKVAITGHTQGDLSVKAEVCPYQPSLEGHKPASPGGAHRAPRIRKEAPSEVSADLFVVSGTPIAVLLQSLAEGKYQQATESVNTLCRACWETAKKLGISWDEFIPAMKSLLVIALDDISGSGKYKALHHKADAVENDCNQLREGMERLQDLTREGFLQILQPDLV